MNREYDLMTAGHLCLDIIPRFPDTGATRIDEIIRPGKLVQVEKATISTGGPVSNTGIALKKLGMKVCFSARIGGDAFGKLTIDMLKENGNAEGVHRVSGSASSYTVALAPPNIDRIFLHNPGTNNEYCADDLDADLISKCRLFHFGYPPLMRRMFQDEGMELKRVFQIAKDAGATTSCDMALPDPASDAGKAPWAKILENILPYIDIYLPSAEECLYMLEYDNYLQLKNRHKGMDLIGFMTPDDYSRLADKILALGTKMTSFKSGPRGFYLKTGSSDLFDGMGTAKPGDFHEWSERELWSPAFSSPKISATGSGDSAVAGFIAAFLKGLSPEKSLQYANCLGWENIQELDAISGIQTWEKTTELLAQGMAQDEIDLSDSDWRWNETHKLWAGPNDKLSKP